MSYTELVITFFGVYVSFYIYVDSIKRGEISRLKDNLISKIEFLHAALKADLQNSTIPIELERTCAARCTQIEFYIKQLNKKVGYELLTYKNLTEIRGIDFNIVKQQIVLDSYFFDFLEVVEVSYLDIYLNNSIFYRIGRFWINQKYFLFGASFSLLIIILEIKVVSIILHAM